MIDDKEEDRIVLRNPRLGDLCFRACPVVVLSCPLHHRRNENQKFLATKAIARVLCREKSTPDKQFCDGKVSKINENYRRRTSRNVCNRKEMDAFVRRIQSNDSKLTTLSLRQTKPSTENNPSERIHTLSTWTGFDQRTIRKATKALQTNHTIRSISCRYDFEYQRILPSRICNYCTVASVNRHGTRSDRDHKNIPTNNNNNNAVTKLQARRFFEACMCLPRLESISLTGGNRWRVSHVVTILEKAKGLRELVVRDVLIKSSSELLALKRILRGGGTQKPLLLESLDLTIEDQTERRDAYWTAESAIDKEHGEQDDPSPFDELLEIISSCGLIKELVLSKSILSRFELRPAPDISRTSLLGMARCRSLQKFVLNGLSLEQGAIEAMCEALIQENGHLTQLQFSGCAFNRTVGQSGWNAMFRLIQHDPTIHIRASSLVYRCKKERRNDSQSGHSYNRIPFSFPSTSEFTCVHNNRSRFIRRPRDDFSFSLRDKEGVDTHFRNQALDVEYTLQEAGFFHLLFSCESSERQPSMLDWINVLSKVKDNSIALFYVLRENPSLCNVKLRSHENEQRQDIKSTKKWRRRDLGDKAAIQHRPKRRRYTLRPSEKACAREPFSRNSRSNENNLLRPLQ